MKSVLRHDKPRLRCTQLQTKWVRLDRDSDIFREEFGNIEREIGKLSKEEHAKLIEYGCTFGEYIIHKDIYLTEILD